MMIASRLIEHAKKPSRCLRCHIFARLQSSNITRDIRGERAFGLGASALDEAVQFVSERLELEGA
jgi:hypothetical protein